MKVSVYQEFMVQMSDFTLQYASLKKLDKKRPKMKIYCNLGILLSRPTEVEKLKNEII